MRKVSVYLDQIRAGSVPAVKMPEHWFGFEDALTIRMNLLIAEMRVRNIATPDWFDVTDAAVVWPARFAPALDEQLARIRTRAEQGLHGRVRLPHQTHELWACFKYTVLARNHNSYLKIGQQIAGRKLDFSVLLADLIAISRVMPRAGGLLNAVQHMWGYVSAFSSLDPNKTPVAQLLEEVQRIAIDKKEPYLCQSTALSELAGWIPVMERVK